MPIVPGREGGGVSGEGGEEEGGERKGGNGGEGWGGGEVGEVPVLPSGESSIHSWSEVYFFSSTVVGSQILLVPRCFIGSIGRHTIS